MVAGENWHPFFLPVTLLLVTMTVAGGWLVAATTIRLIRGSDRGRALSRLLLGCAPLWLFAGHVIYALDAGFSRHERIDMPINLLIPLLGSLTDLEARIRYPERTVGRKVIMISAPSRDAREQVAAMDRHIEHLEARLGRAVRGRIRWVRGPLFGKAGYAIFDLCTGSSSESAKADGAGLDRLDQHEAAHCAITSLYLPQSDPPALLVEGWAEANQGMAPEELAASAWSDYSAGRSLTLRELSSPAWYWFHDGPVYSQGAVLVNYLLRKFGPEKFLKLYTTTQYETFPEDCQRILGMSLDQLEKSMWDDTRQLVIGDAPVRFVRMAPHTRPWLERLKLGPNVKPDAWKSFLSAYFQGADRLLAPYDNARWTVVTDRVYSRPQPETSLPPHEEVRRTRSGEFQSVVVSVRGREVARLASPTVSVQAFRAHAQNPWELEVDSQDSPERRYRKIGHLIDLIDPGYVTMGAVLVSFHNYLQDSGFRLDLQVVVLEPITQSGEPCIRVRLESRAPLKVEAYGYRAYDFVLAANNGLALKSYRYEADSGRTQHGEATYDDHDGVAVLRNFDIVHTSAEGSRFEEHFKVEQRDFGPTPEPEFSLDRFLPGPKVNVPGEPEPTYERPRLLARWYWIPLVVGVVSLGGGVGGGLSMRRRSNGGPPST